MDIKELRELNIDRLGALERGLRKQIFDARIKNYTNQLDDTASIRRMRKDLARVKTVHSEMLNRGVPVEAAPSSAPTNEETSAADTSAEETE